jgi:hypothetical protein
VQTRAKQYGAAFGRGKENLKYKELKKATKGFEPERKRKDFLFQISFYLLIRQLLKSVFACYEKLSRLQCVLSTSACGFGLITQTSVNNCFKNLRTDVN